MSKSPVETDLATFEPIDELKHALRDEHLRWLEAAMDGVDRALLVQMVEGSLAALLEEPIKVYLGIDTADASGSSTGKRIPLLPRHGPALGVLECCKGSSIATSALRETASTVARFFDRVLGAQDAYHRLTEAARCGGVGLYEIRVETGERIWGGNAWALLGLDSDQPPTQEQLESLLHPEDRERVLKHLSTPGAPGEPFTIVYRVIRTDGEVRYIRSNGRWSTAADGAVLATGIAEDVTRQIEQEGIEEEQHHRWGLVLDTRGVCHWDWNIPENTMVWSDSHFKILGMTPGPIDDARGLLATLVHPEDSARMQLEMGDRIKRRVKSFSDEVRFVRPDGGTTWFGIRARLFYNDAGEWVRCIGLGIDITKEKEVERALWESREKLRVATEAGEVGLWYYDLITGEASWDGVHERISGLQQGEFDGRLETALSLLHEDDRPKVLAIIAEAAAHQRADFRLEYRFRQPDGGYRWVLGQGRFQYDADGTLRGMRGSCVDISRIRKTEEALEQSEGRLRMILEKARIGSWSYSPETGSLATSAVAELYGVPQELPFTAFLERVHPADLEMCKRAMESCITSSRPIDVDYRCLDSDGQYRWLSSRGIYDLESRLIVGITIDIDERKRGEEVLRKLEERWSMALSGTRDGVWDWNLLTNEVFYSDRLKSMLGFEPDEWGTALDEWSKRVHPEDLPGAMAAIKEHLDGKVDQYTHEHRLLHKDGSYRWILDRGVAFRREDGQPFRMVGAHVDLTARREYEDALQKSEERLRLAMDAGELALWDWDVATGRLFWSDQMYTMFGIDRGTFECTISNFLGIHADSPGGPKLISDIEQHMRERMPSIHGVYHLCKQDGTLVWIRGSAAISYDEEGRPTRMTGALIDVTSLKDKEQQLCEAKRGLELAVKAGRLSPFRVDLLTGEVQNSEYSRAAAGLKQPEMLALAHPEDVDAIRNTMVEACATRQPFELEYRFQVDGQYRWLLSMGQVDEAGLAMHGVTTDITDRKQAEIEREMFVQVTQQTGAFQALMDLEGALTFVNQNGLDLVGRASHEGILYDELLSVQDRAIFRKEILPTVLSRGIWTGEFRYLHAQTGESIPVVNHVFQITDPIDGHPVALGATSQDIRERLAIEGKVRGLNDELEDRVKQRTLALTEANKELEAFTYMVAHDLRAPLRSIMSTSMILLEDYTESLPEEAQHELTRQSTAARRLSMLLDDLLTLSRLGRSVVNRVEFNLSKVAEEVAEELGDKGWHSHVEFCIEPHIMVEADPRLLRLVLQNLLENGCKFGRHGEKNVVTFGSSNGPKGTTYFVSDQGIGFNQEYEPKVFKPFERLVRDDEYPGTGIGLANVRRIIDRHNGKIWARSREGKGATFYFTL